MVTQVTIFLLAPINVKNVETKFHGVGSVFKKHKVTKSYISCFSIAFNFFRPVTVFLCCFLPNFPTFLDRYLLFLQ